MYDHCAHAAHNEQVFRHLDKYEEYADWAITTAFYSALHLVRHLIITDAAQKGADIDFDTLYEKKKTKKMGRHGFQRHFVHVTCPDEIDDAYSYLSEMGMKARYKKFTFTRKDVIAAQQCLETIKRYVDKTVTQ